jgi:acyl-coenzyme A thioesterase PaaI-like protein
VSVDAAPDAGPGQHLLGELGFSLHLTGDELHGRAEVVPEMFVPGTDCLRTSILATWADHVSGLLVSAFIAPRVPVTLELDVHVYRELRGLDVVHAAGRTLKAGRSVAVTSVDFTDGDGAPVAVAAASFMPAPDASLTLPPLSKSIAMMKDRRPTLEVPLADRARIERVEPGTAVVPAEPDGRNASNTLNGGRDDRLAVAATTRTFPPRGA